MVQGLRRQSGRRCSSLRRISRVSEPPRRVVYPWRLVQTVCYRLTHSELVDLRVWAIKAESTRSRAKSAFCASPLATAPNECLLSVAADAQGSRMPLGQGLAGVALPILGLQDT